MALAELGADPKPQAIEGVVVTPNLAHDRPLAGCAPAEVVLLVNRFLRAVESADRQRLAPFIGPDFVVCGVCGSWLSWSCAWQLPQLAPKV